MSHIKCPRCESYNFSSSAFCIHCGVWLKPTSSSSVNPTSILCPTQNNKMIVPLDDSTLDELADDIILIKLDEYHAAVLIQYQSPIYVGRHANNASAVEISDDSGHVLLLEDGSIECNGEIFNFLPNANPFYYQGIESVSRYHLKLVRQEKYLLAIDLGSLNGTYINGGKLANGLVRPLKDQSTLSLGAFKLNLLVDPIQSMVV